MFVFPTDVTDLVIRQKEEDNQTITGEEYADVVAVGENTGNDYLYYGKPDTKYRALTNMDGIRLYVLPYPIEKIYSSAFSDATSLERVVLSDAMVYIGDCAFKNCTNLKRINLPSSIETIEPSAFEDCPNLVAYVDEGSYAEAYCKENGIQIEYTGNVVTNEYGVSEYEMSQLEEWKQELCSQINTKFGEERDSYLFDLVYVDDDEDAELVVYKKDSGDFQQMMKIYYLYRGGHSKNSTLEELVGDAEGDYVFDRTVYIIDREDSVLSVTNQENTNLGAEDGSTCTMYNLCRVRNGESLWAGIYYNPDGIYDERNYNYIMETFDMDKARKISSENLVSFDEIIDRIIKE